MWPKMLFELLPHVGRVIPMAEKFFATRSAREQQEQAALTAVAEDLRGGLTQISALQQTADGHSAQIAALASGLTQLRSGVESVDGRIGRLEDSIAAAETAASRAEKAARRLAAMLPAILILLILLIVAVVSVLVRLWSR